MIPLFLDFETYYDPDYSLRKMSTAEYIRDSRFQVLGAGLGVEDITWQTGDALARTLVALPWDQIELVAHNATFDGSILARLGVRPARYACTMFMLRYLIAQGDVPADVRTSLRDAAPLVGREKGDLDAALAGGHLDQYAVLDTEICRDLYHKYWHRLSEEERDYIDLHVRMAAEPVLDLDVPRLEALRDKDTAMEALFPVVRNEPAFAAALEALGVTPRWKTTAKGSYKLATAKTDGWLAELEQHEDPRVRQLAEVRRKASSTIERSRADRFLRVGAPLPVPLLYYGAHTGRSSGSDSMNLQNLNREGDLRGSIRAPKGHVLVVVDSAQVEVRVLAWLAGVKSLLAAFAAGADPYKKFGAEHLYRCSEDEVVGEKRNIAKAAVLALGFGQGAGGFLAYCARFGIAIDPDFAKTVVRTYREAYPEITGGSRVGGLWKKIEREVIDTGRQVLPSGRVLTYPDLGQDLDGYVFRRHSIFSKSRTSRDVVNLWYGLLTENKVQAVARDVVFWQTRRLARDWRVVLSAHDEAVLCVPVDRAEEARKASEEAFASVPPWAAGLPTKGEAKIMERYGK